MTRHASDSSEQRDMEAEILAAIEREWGIQFAGRPEIDQRVELDGFVDGRTPICVEAWARQSEAEDGQQKKVMRDFCKLLLIERLLGRPCRKVFAVSNEVALRFLANSWMGRFADEFGIERVVVDVSEESRQQVREAQQRQYR